MTLTLVERFVCSGCGDTPPMTAAPRWLRDPKQPIPGSRVAVCPKCYREANSDLRQPRKCGGIRAQEASPAPHHGPSIGASAPSPLAEQPTTAQAETNDLEFLRSA